MGLRWAQRIDDRGYTYYQWFDHEEKDDNGLTAYDRAIGDGGGWSAVTFDESQSFEYRIHGGGGDLWDTYQLNPDGMHGCLAGVLALTGTLNSL